VRVLLTLGALLCLAGCDVPNAEARREAAALTGGDPTYGPALMRKYGCQACHTIPGVDGANGLVGPPLAGIAARSYIGGVLPNTPANMMRWIQNPKGVDSLTAMPNTGVTDSDVRHIAAYLYTLK
jgi:cytochrome c1